MSNELEKEEALGYIVKHLEKNIREDELKFTAHQLEKVTVLRVKIEGITGKKSVS